MSAEWINSRMEDESLDPEIRNIFERVLKVRRVTDVEERRAVVKHYADSYPAGSPFVSLIELLILSGDAPLHYQLSEEEIEEMLNRQRMAA